MKPKLLSFLILLLFLTGCKEECKDNHNAFLTLADMNCPFTACNFDNINYGECYVITNQEQMDSLMDCNCNHLINFEEQAILLGSALIPHYSVIKNKEIKERCGKIRFTTYYNMGALTVVSYFESIVIINKPREGQEVEIRFERVIN